jgi:uncharacterized protein DUF2334
VAKVRALHASCDAELDRERTARLLFDRELAAGALDPVTLESALPSPLVCRAAGVRPIPPRSIRVVQQALYKLGRLSFERDVVAPMVAARSALCARADALPRFLVRVDEFPHYRALDDPRRFGTAAFERFHEIMAAYGVPYLLAVLPNVSHRPLSPEALGERMLDEGEIALLRRLGEERVTIALHGFNHRTRHPSPRRRSELCGLTPDQTKRLLERGLSQLEPHRMRPDVFVPPYNRFDASQLGVLARRFAVVCGGPESIGWMGFQRTPQWRGDTVYLPSYAPFYGRSAEILPAADRAIERSTGLWTPIVLHWGWEAEQGWSDLERLVERIAGSCVHWDDFLRAVERSRDGSYEVAQ